MKLMLLTLLVGAAYSAPGHDIVKKSGNVPPRKFPMWHLEPLYVRKIPDNKQEKILFKYLVINPVRALERVWKCSHNCLNGLCLLKQFQPF